MKKLTAIILGIAAALCLAIGFSGCDLIGSDGSGDEQVGVENNGLEFDLQEGDFYFVSGLGDCADTEIIIPSTYNGKPVKGIALRAFFGCDKLTSVTVPDSVTSIGRKAFYNCSDLTNISIPDSVTEIAENAFENCEKLADFTFPAHVTEIAESAFSGCTALSKVIIPDSVKSIENMAFNNCGKLTSIYYSGDIASWCNISGLSNLMSYGENNKRLFINSAEITGDLVIPDGATKIGAYTFSGCSGLTSVVIPDCVTEVDSLAFVGCDNVIQTEKGIRYVDKWAIGCDSSLTEIALRSDTKGISNAFCDYSRLTSIVIPDSVKYIGDFSFFTWDGISKDKVLNLTMPTNVIKHMPIHSAQNVIITSGASIEREAFKDCTKLISVTINDGITSIGNYAFENCRNLTSIAIPDSVTRIGRFVFYGCDDLIQIENGIQYVDKWVIGCDDSLTEVVLRSNTKGIAHSALDRCGVFNIVLPDGLISIDFGALAGVYGSVTIPSSVKYIGERVFRHVTDIYFDGTKEQWNAIIKNDSWDSNMDEYTVHYTDDDNHTHIYDKQVVENKYIKSAATCTAKAVYYLSCECGEIGTETFEHGELAAHTEVIDQAVASTCTEMGKTEGKHCSVCNTVLVAQIDLPPVHTTYFHEAREATCTEVGWAAYETCVFCSYTTYKELPATGHTEVIDEAVAPTCTETGLTEGKHCSVCNTVLSAQTKIPATGHTEVIDKAVAPTCTETGLSEGKHCSVCNIILIEQQVASAKGHSWNYEQSEHTHTATCSNCNEIITSTEHSWNDNVCTACGYDVGGSKGLKWTLNNGEYTVSGIGSCEDTKIVLPSFFNEKPVTNIGPYAFRYCNSLTSIDMPNSVTSIGDGAFDGCSGLTSITIPDSVTSIGELAFYSCSGLMSITIGNSVTSIGSSAFSGCSSLTGVTIPNGVTSIGDGAFDGCSGLTSITIPDSVTSMGQNTFSWCNNLKELTIPFIGERRFGADNTNFSVIFGNNNSVPDSLKSVKVTGGESISDHAFDGCSGLTSITIPDSVTSIGEKAFFRCSGLKNIIIPNGVTSIGGSAFYDCSGLTSITIPDSVTSIGSSAFHNCSSLTSITLPFIGATKDGTVDTEFLYIFGTYHPDSDVPKSLKSVIITGGEKINVCAFWLCSGLTSITIPNSVKSIERQAFDGCSGLTNITIPDSVTSIDDHAFDGCSGLTNITIPDSVTSFGSATFRNCSSLASITIPSGVTSLGWQTFFNCSGLTSITVREGNSVYHSAGNCLIETASKKLILGCQNSVIPNDGSVTSIGSSAFYNCRGLASIVIPDSIASLEGAFSGCGELQSITVGEGNLVYHSTGNCLIETASKKLIRGCQNSVIPDDGSVTSIGNSAFSGCSGLTSITIPDSVTSIGNSAFSNCSGLTSITIPDSVTSIGDGAFNGCIGLTSITIPDSVTSIGEWAFYGCSSLTSVTIGSGVTSIGGSAFNGCIGLTSIIIPNSVTSIGEWAFHNCSGLTSIFIPNSVTSIGDVAFASCSELTSVTFNGAMQQWKAIEKGGNWNYNTGDYIVTCTDGKLDKNGNVIQ